MKIKKIVCQNFRQFKDRTELSFDTTSGKVNIIYGMNGTGKTTLHQLFQWIFYGKYNFSNDISNKLYNVAVEDAAKPNSSFDVYGMIEYYDEKFKTDFRLSRTQRFTKELLQTRESTKIVKLLYKKSNGDWVEANKSPQDFLNVSLPEALAHYFFFDGERMVKQFIPGKHSGADEEKKLKNTIFNIFKLDVYKNALQDLGNELETSTAIGRILSNVPKSGKSTLEAKAKYERLCDEVQAIEKQISKTENEISNCENIIREKTELIGQTKTLTEIERIRNDLIDNKRKALKALEDSQRYFSEKLIEVYPYLLLSNKMLEAKEELGMQMSKTDLPIGLNRDLILDLMEKKICICGEPLDSNHKNILESWLDLLPPRSPKIVYDNFVREATRVITESKNKLSGLSQSMKNIIESDDNLNTLEEQINGKHYETLKNAAEDIKPIVEERKKYEQALVAHRQVLSNQRFQLREKEPIKQGAYNTLKHLLEQEENFINQKAKAEILELVKQSLKSDYDALVSKYTQSLSRNIDNLLCAMFSGQRTSKLDSEFVLHVYDDYQNEAMSEGQFAVVTFAYIGGILATLKEHNISKTFPLVLDGPFSKLDSDHRKNVCDKLSSFANQVIIFSKDMLEDVIDNTMIGSVYRIETNDQKNLATIEVIR